MTRKIDNPTVKKTLYIDKKLEKRLKIQAVLEEKNESTLLNEILSKNLKKWDGESKSKT